MNTNSTVVLLQQKNISDKGSTMTKNNLSQRHFLEKTMQSTTSLNICCNNCEVWAILKPAYG